MRATRIFAASLGTAVAGSASKTFGAAAGWDTPAGVLTLMENDLVKVTAPIGVNRLESPVLKMLPQTSSSEQSEAELQLIAKMNTYADAQGKSDRTGLVRYLSDTFNGIPQMRDVKPDQKLLGQASAMLKHLGIHGNKDQSLAVGLAKASVAGSQALQALENTSPARPTAVVRTTNTPDVKPLRYPGTPNM